MSHAFMSTSAVVARGIAGSVQSVAITTLPMVRPDSRRSCAILIVSGVSPVSRVVTIGRIRPSATCVRQIHAVREMGNVRIVDRRQLRIGKNAITGLEGKSSRL